MNNPIDDLRRYADDLASEASPFVAQRAVRSAMAPNTRRPRKAVVVLVTTALFGVSNVALAATADPAIPGDALYGVDRAYEQVADFVGLRSSRVTERITETGALVEQGRLAEALDLVQETLGKVLESDDPQAELEELTEATAGVPQPVSDLVLNELVVVARGTADGTLTGSEVATLARELGAKLREQRSNRPDHAGPPAGVPANPGNPQNTP